MDKNSWIGMALILAVLFGWSYYTRPSEEQIKQYRERQDSIARVEQANQLAREQANKNTSATAVLSDADDKDTAAVAKLLTDQFGDFAPFATGNREFNTIENDLMKITFTNLGGRISSVELKNYKTCDSTPLVLFSGDSAVFSLDFFAQNRRISTGNLFFAQTATVKGGVVDTDSAQVIYALNLDNNRSMEFVYTIYRNSYEIGFDVRMNKMNKLILTQMRYMQLNWQAYITGFEKGRKWETMNSTVAYRYWNDDVDMISEQKETASETINSKLQWIDFKQQFFNMALVSNTGFLNANISKQKVQDSKYFSKFTADISVPFEGTDSETISMRMFYGPNQYNILKDLGIGLQNIIPLGRSIFRWVNVGIVIPLFNLLGKFISNYGIIILIMTIIIKLVLFPLTYKSYISTGKMTALKPEIDKLNEKYPKQEDAMKKQQATMELYKKAGINPMGGCLPMLLQMPLLIAMFRFFPASIELRQQSFLWCDDLSTYDAILNLPFNIPWYGDHVSLFCLLMTVVNILYIKLNGQATGGQQMPGMKMMMYMMPVMMLFWFNDYAAALSYYYFISLLITIVQTYVMRRFVNTEALLAKIHETKKKTTVKSNFQKRMEEAAKKRGIKF
ncbi:MAG: membrane protein insertase YidC [Salinivirgaceae bacterium]|nr:membrane protein insertase YidC [Salinivirgaceae bacterium]